MERLFSYIFCVILFIIHAITKGHVTIRRVYNLSKELAILEIANTFL